MSHIQNNINNDFKHNKNIKIKYETSKPSYLLSSNADKLIKYFGNKASNSSHLEENKALNGSMKNNHRFDKNHNSVRKRLKEKNNKNKDKLNKKDSTEKYNKIVNRIKSPTLTIESPLTKSKIHKRINSLHINGNNAIEKKNLKTMKNKNNPNLNLNNSNKNISNNKHINSNHKNIINNKNMDPTISNNLSISSENKKSAKKENNQNYTIQMKIEKLDSKDMHFSFNSNLDNINLLENGQKKVNLKKNVLNGSNTLSGKIASRAKNLNKMLEANFNSVKKEIKDKEKNIDKDNDIKKEEKNEINDNTINSKNLSLNEFEYHSINSSDKANYNNDNNQNRLIKPKINKPFSSELAQRKQKMQHKTASLNRSLELRKKNKLNDNNDININKNNLNNSSGKKEKKVFSKNDFRQMNTSPFVRSKPPIRPKHTNYIAKKNILKKSTNNNMKSIDKKFKSPQKDINSVNGIISLDMQPKANNNNLKKNILPKKKKIISKRKNKSMIIDNKLKEKNINISKFNEKEDNINKSNIEKEDQTIDATFKSNNAHKKNPNGPIRAQSQQEINTELIIDSINELLENKPKNENIENNIIPIKKIEKKILKMQSLCKKGFAGPGIKKTNQDNFFIYNNFNNNPNYIYMGVCDGHGMFGQDVSGYLVNTLPQNMNINLLNLNIPSLSTESSEKIFPIITSTFVSTNIEMTEDERVDSSFSGSTCVSLFYTPEKLICANVGDSRCIIGKFDGKNWKSKNLSRDQKPSEQDEYERIINSGGRIESFKDENGNYVGPERVWLKDEDVPGLAMSRSFGDEIAHTVGVITEPEINEYLFAEEDKFIIIASDGLWEFISSDECVGMIKDFYLKNDIESALNYLYKESSKRWIMEEEVIDDITILMAFLN